MPFQGYLLIIFLLISGVILYVVVFCDDTFSEKKNIIANIAKLNLFIFIKSVICLIKLILFSCVLFLLTLIKILNEFKKNKISSNNTSFLFQNKLQLIAPSLSKRNTLIFVQA